MYRLPSIEAWDLNSGPQGLAAIFYVTCSSKSEIL